MNVFSIRGRLGSSRHGRCHRSNPFQAAFSASQSDPELSTYYLCKRAGGKGSTKSASLVSCGSSPIASLPFRALPNPTNYQPTLSNAAQSA